MSFADTISPQFANLLLRADSEAKPDTVIDLSAIKDRGRTDSGVILSAGPDCKAWAAPGVRVLYDSRAARLIAPEGVAGTAPILLIHQDEIRGTIEVGAVQ